MAHARAAIENSKTLPNSIRAATHVGVSSSIQLALQSRSKERPCAPEDEPSMSPPVGLGYTQRRADAVAVQYTSI
jgi:hypothetical protein